MHYRIYSVLTLDGPETSSGNLAMEVLSVLIFNLQRRIESSDKEQLFCDERAKGGNRAVDLDSVLKPVTSKDAKVSKCHLQKQKSIQGILVTGGFWEEDSVTNQKLKSGVTRSAYGNSKG